jgi:serine/threonine protein kinase/tetratricopeptide (TPR) repeat protein
MASKMLIGKRYRLDEKIGQGGMGLVYRGIDTKTHEVVAVKQLQASIIAKEPDVLERFAREGEALRQLNHPNIVKHLAALEENGNSYLVMEFVSGGDLYRLLHNDSALSINRILQISLDLADALTRAHRLQIIHRDLKPANVLLADDGTPRLTDFGVAHIGTKERVTGTGTAVGTIDYISPESLKGDVVDTRTDIWSFGVMLFEMLTGRKPFSSENVTQTLLSIVGDPVPDLEQFRPDAPIGLVDLIYRMLEKDPQARIPSIRQVGVELEALLEGRIAHGMTPPRIASDDKRFATPTPSHAHKHNLPAQTTPFVGRASELEELSRLIHQPDIRLVTILAPGGMGKTRISLEVAGQFVVSNHEWTSHDDHFHNGVYFVELAPLCAVESIPSAIAEAVGYQFQSDGRDPKHQIVDFLREKSVLLLMDNFEHMIEGAGIVSDILHAAPEVKIIATSRQRLNQSGETIFNLEGMDFPEWRTLEEALEFSAVKLFLQGARRVRPDFELRVDDLKYIAHVSRMVDGLPLGILLAASWLEMLSLQEITEEMAQNLDFLETEMSDIPERQRSIRAVFDYSWKLMNAEEQDVYMRLSVFRGGFTREAAQAVTGANLRTLMSLLNKSVIRRDPNDGRYDVHELLRQYSEEYLHFSGEEDETRAIHSAVYVQEVQNQHPVLLSANQLTAIKAIEADLENIKNGLRWAAEHSIWDGIDSTLEGMTLYYEMVSRFQEYSNWLNELERRAVQGGLREDNLLFWRIRTARARALARFGHYQAGQSLAEECLAVFEEANDTYEIAYVYGTLCYATMFQGKYADAKAYAQIAVEIASAGANLDLLGSTIGMLGYAHFLAGEYDDARQIYEQSIVKIERIGSPPGIAAQVYNNLGEIYHALRDEDKAKPLFEKSFTLFKSLNNKYGMAFSLNNLGNVAHTAANWELAQTYNQQALDLYREIGDQRGAAEALNRIGGNFFSMGEYAKAQPYHEEALAIYRTMGDKRGIANSLVQVGQVFNAFGDYPQAIQSVSESLELRRSMSNPAEIADSLWFMCFYTSLNGSTYEEAISHLDEADKLLLDVGIVHPRYRAFRAIITSHYKRFDQAKLLLEELRTFENQGNPNPWNSMQFHFGIGRVLAGLGHYQEAKPHARQAIEIGRKFKMLDWAMNAVNAGAFIIGKEGRVTEAVTWLAFNSEYPRYYAFMRQFAREYLSELLPELSPREYADAVERSKTLDVETVLNQVLNALQ